MYRQIAIGVGGKRTTPLHVSGVPRIATGAMTICKAHQTRQGSKGLIIKDRFSIIFFF